MCTFPRRKSEIPATPPYEGETRQLRLQTDRHELRCLRSPWHALWLIWPLTYVLKGAAGLAAPALAWLNQPLLLTLTPLPLLLIGAGVVLLLAAGRRK